MIENNGRFRILILDSNSQIAQLRVLEECEDSETCIKKRTIACCDASKCPHGNRETGHDCTHQTACINTTLRELKSLKEKLDTEENERLMIRLVDRVNIRCYIVRIDNKMLAAPYLGHIPGNDLPTLELSRENPHLFNIFQGEFEKVWVKSKEWDWKNWELK